MTDGHIIPQGIMPKAVYMGMGQQILSFPVNSLVRGQSFGQLLLAHPFLTQSPSYCISRSLGSRGSDIDPERLSSRS